MRLTEILVKDVGPFSHPLNLRVQSGKDDSLADTVILTGPNGSGKSTILYAIAAVLGSPEMFLERAWGPHPMAAALIETRSGIHTSAISLESRHRVDSPFDSAVHLHQATRGGNIESSWSHHGAGPSDRPNKSGPHDSGIFSVWTDRKRVSQEAVLREFPVWFAYSSMRTIDPDRKSLSTQLAVSEPDPKSILVGALSGRTGDQSIFETWLKLSFIREALSDGVEAEQYASTRKLCEESISRMVEDDFQFVFDRRDFSIRARLGQSRPSPLDLLPDGLKSILSWVGDLLARLSWLPTPEGTNPTELPFVLLLDEIEAHLHPAWQRQVVPMVERLFPAAQIFLASHSPFVIGSASDTQIFELSDGQVAKEYGSQIGRTFANVTTDLMGVGSPYDPFTANALRRFEEIRVKTISGQASLDDLREEAASLRHLDSEELEILLQFQLDRTAEMLEE